MNKKIENTNIGIKSALWSFQSGLCSLFSNDNRVHFLNSSGKNVLEWMIAKEQNPTSMSWYQAKHGNRILFEVFLTVNYFLC